MTRTEFLPFYAPDVGDEEVREVSAALRSGWLTTGPRVQQFEEEFATAVGAPAAAAVNSGTAALHVSLTALGIGPGDVVVTTPMTFASSIHVIEHVGARPVFADVDPDTLNIDPDGVRRAVKEAEADGPGPVRAILPVHLYGHPCDMDALAQIAEDHGLDLVQDAAHALPSSWRGHPIGGPVPGFSGKSLTCFSFYATKNLTTGEGGMFTGDPALVDEARAWILHGMSRDAWRRYASDGSWHYDVLHAGFKYNMTDQAAALGLVQLRRLPEFQARRGEIVRRYDRAFGEIPEIETPRVHPDAEHAWHLYVIRLRLDGLRIDRDRFIEELGKRNIGTSVHFIPIHLFSHYRDRYGFRPEDFPVAYGEYGRIVSLPLYPRMSDRDVDDVVEAVAGVVAEHRR
ncbi:MAG: DegT/DnrJ/EryC1/StrS aminotransferase family protein [Actinomycetota bacterium]|nr:DegT/DnrJ/EryC1/StrS aminotransferase family protein [Actinomycetota bacterium]